LLHYLSSACRFVAVVLSAHSGWQQLLLRVTVAQQRCLQLRWRGLLVRWIMQIFEFISYRLKSAHVVTAIVCNMLACC
jgi:hypothetical protein